MSRDERVPIEKARIFLEAVIDFLTIAQAMGSDQLEAEIESAHSKATSLYVDLDRLAAHGYGGRR